MLTAAGVSVAALAFGLLFARSRVDSYDSGIMLQVAQSLVNEHSLRVHQDLFGFNQPYASYGIGMSLLFVVPVMLAEHLGRDPASLAMLVNPVVFALTVTTIFYIVVLLGGTSRQPPATSLLTGFGTLLVSFTATGFSEPAVALAIALGILGVVASRRPWGAALTGAAAALALLMREDSAVLVLPILGVAMWWANRWSWRALATFAVVLLPAVLLTAEYNNFRYGAPWRSGYGLAFNHPIGPGLYGLLLSPTSGLVIYVPLVIVALVGMPGAWRRNAAVAATAVSLLAVRIPFFAVWWDWSGQTTFGPRFLVPAMPALAVGLFEIVARFRSLQFLPRAAVLSLACLSISVATVGAAVRPEANSLTAAAGHRPLAQVPIKNYIRVQSTVPAERELDGYLFDWRYFPPLDEARLLIRNQSLTGRYLGPPAQRGQLILLGFVAAIGLTAAFAASRVNPTSLGQSDAR